MKLVPKITALCATAAMSLLAVTASPKAASIISEAFLANVRPNVDFLQGSSRLAADHSGNRRLRAFAQSEDAEQRTTSSAIIAWVQGKTLRGTIGVIAAVGPTLPSPVDVAEAPVAMATDPVTGRSVAVDLPVAIDASPEARRELLPAGQTDLDRLSSLRGKAFDRLYRGTQLDALRQLSTLYAAYIQNGDDPALRAMAVDELPKVNARIARVTHL